MSDEEREEEEKETYHKVDKRSWLQDEGAEQEAPTPPEQVPAEPAAPEESHSHSPVTDEVPPPAETPAEEAPPEMEVDVYGLLRMCLGMFAEQAWVQMGIQLGPGAKELKTDLTQAKTAIDTVNFMKEALGHNLSPEEKREVEQLLTTLRTNYIQRT